MEKNYKISEINSIFRNRTEEKVLVNLKLIIESFIGLCKLYLIKNLPKFNFFCLKPNFLSLLVLAIKVVGELEQK